MTTSAAPLASATRRDAYAAARAICRHHARSFYFASHFLPRAKRDHAYAVYGFCRLLDDAADENPSAASVEAFVSLLDHVYDDAPATDHAFSARDRLALDAFAHTVRACAIPRRYFLDLADGCRMDFTVARYATWTDLERYCYHVAGVVGLIMCRVFDLRDDAALGQAVHMGNAMQLTNILRDVAEDFRRGRIYLPREDLDRFGIGEADLAAGTCDERFRSLMRFEIDRARGLYDLAARGLAKLPADGSRLTACVMAVVYSGILGAIERQGLDVFTGRASIGIGRKLLKLRAARRLSRWDGSGAVPDVFG